MPHTRCARGPSPVTAVVEEASYKVAASGKHLLVLPAAREALWDSDKIDVATMRNLVALASWSRAVLHIRLVPGFRWVSEPVGTSS